MEQNNNQIAVRPVQKTAVMMRREMVKIPAVMGALGPVEKAVFLASTAKTIAEYDAPELSAELAVALKWICKDVGYRSPDESDRQYLVIRTAEILKRYYAGLSLKDFRMAFEMSLTGELDDFLPRGRDGQPDRNHYQQFNAEYVCKILNAYKGRRGWILKKAYEAVPRTESEPDPAMKEVYRKNAIRDLTAHFDAFKETGKLNTNALTDLIFYNILTDFEIVPIIEITPDEQRYVWYQAINKFAQRGMVGDVNRLKKQGIEAPELRTSAFILARHNALKRVFSSLLEQGKNIRDIIGFFDGK